MLFSRVLHFAPGLNSACLRKKIAQLLVMNCNYFKSQYGLQNNWLLSIKIKMPEHNFDNNTLINVVFDRSFCTSDLRRIFIFDIL